MEGSPIFDKLSGNIIGIRLPNLHTYNLYMSCAIFTSLSTLLANLNKLKIEKPLTNSSLNFRDLIVKIKDGHLK